LGYPNLRWFYLSLLPDTHLQRLLNQLQHTPVGNPLGDQLHQLPVRNTREVGFEINFHHTPRMFVQVCANRQRCLPRVPLGPVPVGAGVEVRLKDWLQDQLHGRLHHAIFYRRDAQGPGSAFRLGNRHHPDRRKLIVMRLQCDLQLLDQRYFLP